MPLGSLTPLVPPPDFSDPGSIRPRDLLRQLHLPLTVLLFLPLDVLAFCTRYVNFPTLLRAPRRYVIVLRTGGLRLGKTPGCRGFIE